MHSRHETKEIKIGNIKIGKGNPIAVQSMTKTDTRNVEATVAQIKRMEKSGCEIVRLSVLDIEAAEALAKIRKSTTLPLVADIHFDYLLALKSIESGVDKLRLNPGNIKEEKKIIEVVKSAKDKGIPIRIGVNSGSLDNDISQKYGNSAKAVFESVASHVSILEKHNFYDIVLSVKCSDVMMTIDSYKLCAKEYDYPLHLGITESGPTPQGLTKSAVGIGIMLNMGIGDTVRVSLTDDPEIEISSAYDILRALDLRKRGLDIISCPTCGRCKVNMRPIVEEVRDRLAGFEKPLKIAIMGCEVNGPKEAIHADVGLACGNGCGLLFENGEIIKKVSEEDMVETFLKLVQK